MILIGRGVGVLIGRAWGKLRCRGADGEGMRKVDIVVMLIGGRLIKSWHRKHTR